MADTGAIFVHAALSGNDYRSGNDSQPGAYSIGRTCPSGKKFFYYALTP
jgi:hypothetical protein